MGMVETYRQQNRVPDALALLQNETDKNPQRADFRLALAATAVLGGKFDLAIKQYETVLGMLGSQSTARADIYLRLGETYRREGLYDKSIEDLEMARKILPENPVVLSTLALSLESAGKKVEARQTYERALNVDPDNGVALNNLAFLIAETGGDLERALTLAQKAKQLLPNLDEVSDTLGMIYLRKNLSDNAIDIFRDLVSKEPAHATFHYHLGMAFSQKGDKSKARQELQEALKTKPTDKEREQIQQLMNRLG